MRSANPRPRAWLACAACLAWLGCASAPTPSHSMLDAVSGARVTLRQAPLPDDLRFDGSYISPQLGKLVLTTAQGSLQGHYHYAQGGCDMTGRLRGELHGNLAELELRESSSNCKDIGELHGRGLLFLDRSAAPGRPVQLLGKRHLERIGAWSGATRAPEVVSYDTRNVTAVRVSSEPACPPTHAPMPEPAITRLPTPTPTAHTSQPQCSRVPELRARSVPERQARLDSTARALNAARARAEHGCVQGSACNRNAPPWRDVFSALRDAEQWLLLAQAAGDAAVAGDDRQLELTLPCYALRLDALVRAFVTAGQRDVEGLRELLPIDPVSMARCVLDAPK